MRDDLLLYYERELTFLRQMGAEFAAKYPKIASRLVLEPDKCEDPHVERMLEAFAFLTARVHLKIDDEFPEITEALLSILYPHYLRPDSLHVGGRVPHGSRAGGAGEGGLKLDRGSVLNSRPVNGVPCKFRTCYDLTFWPLEVTEAEWKTPDRLQPPVKSSEAVAAVRIALRCHGRPEVRPSWGSRRCASTSTARATWCTRCMSCCATTAATSSFATPRPNRARSR